jgi:hypothetical protein
MNTNPNVQVPMGNPPSTPSTFRTPAEEQAHAQHKARKKERKRERLRFFFSWCDCCRAFGNSF